MYLNLLSSSELSAFYPIYSDQDISKDAGLVQTTTLSSGWKAGFPILGDLNLQWILHGPGDALLGQQVVWEEIHATNIWKSKWEGVLLLSWGQDGRVWCEQLCVRACTFESVRAICISQCQRQPQQFANQRGWKWSEILPFGRVFDIEFDAEALRWYHDMKFVLNSGWCMFGPTLHMTKQTQS